MTAFPSLIQARRLELGFTLRDVQEITNGKISNAYLSQIETGKIASPSFNVICELSAAYALPLDKMRDWLEWESDTPAPIICHECGRAMPRTAQGIEARQRHDPEEGRGPKDESPVAESDAP